MLAIGELKKNLKASDILIGNGLHNYNFKKGLGHPTYDYLVDALDGFVMEHVMSFEAAYRNVQHQPFHNVDALRNLIELRNLLVSKNKYLLSNNHPGPVGKPFVNINNMRIPSTPVHYHYPQPTTNLEAQQAMKDLYKFPLSV